MTDAFAGLVAAAVAFVGTHFALSHPLRAPLVRMAGDKGFQAAYSLVAFATLGWLVVAFRAATGGAMLWDGFASAPWIAATVLMLVASVLLVGSFMGNPALPAPNAAEVAARGPHGVFHVTRHPMMWSFALWSASHLLVSPTPRVLVLTLAIAALALIGSHLQDRKKQVLMGHAWADWEAKTSYWPRLGGLAKAGAVPWLGGMALWLIASWAHGPLIAVPAGAWRWIG
ncbi:NnrU family protein [Novosphingobium sp. NPDC080210]|uniref:NnrU family protein n=1 Tax=Novosphingobium sp. NPDC080210 TaxID=3390596 RepID=UPI003D080C0D